MLGFISAGVAHMKRLMQSETSYRKPYGHFLRGILRAAFGGGVDLEGSYRGITN